MTTLFDPTTGRTQMAGYGDYHCIEMPNDTVTGTFTNGVVKHTFDSPAKLISTSPGDVNATGICMSGCGTSGNAKVALIGKASCVFDGPTVAHEYVTISTTEAGKCHSTPAPRPRGGRILGLVQTTNGSAGTYDITLFGIGVLGSIQVNATENLTAQAIAIPATPLFTNDPATDDMHEFSWYMVVEQAGTGGTLSLTLTWNDGIAVQTYTTSTLALNGLGNSLSGNLPVMLGPSQTIQYSTTILGGSGSPLYGLKLRSRQL